MKPPISDTIRFEVLGIGVIALGSLCWGLAFGGGFQGWDDLHYTLAAQDWFHNGLSLPTDHWAGRLPYVLLLASGMMLFGFNLTALVIPNSLLFLIVILTSWWIAKLKFGSRAAFFTIILAGTTPLFVRFPETFYPEALETALCGLEFVLVLIVIRSPTAERGAAILLGAGVIGGSALVLRATSAVLPLGLALFIFLELWRHPRSTFILICSLAGGYLIPLVGEALYYYTLTGEPFYRYMIDSSDGVVNDEMVGETVSGRNALLNFHLAQLWSSWAPAIFDLHWTVNHLVNLFTTPSLLLTPYLGLAGTIYGLWCTRTRNFALFVLVVFILQYILYTFVFVLSPTPRYYAISVFFFCIFGGLLLSSLSLSILRSGFLIVQAGSAVVIGLTQISPQPIVKALIVDSQQISGIYISSKTASAAYLELARDSRLADSIRVGFPPIGMFGLIGWDGWPKHTLKRTCDDGTPQWNVVETSTNPSIPWRVINYVYPKAASDLPDRIVSYLRRDVENVVLAQRRC